MHRLRCALASAAVRRAPLGQRAGPSEPRAGLRRGSAWPPAGRRPAARYSTAAEADRRDLLKKYGPPISIAGGAGEGATALFVRANMDKAQSQVDTSVKKLLDLLRSDKELRVFLRSSHEPGSVFTTEKVEKFASALQKNLGLDEVTTDFINYMYRNKILSDIETVLESYQKMSWRAKKEVHATLVCVSEAEARRFSQSKEFAALVSDYVPKDFKLQLEFAADPAIGDGFRIDLGDRQVELTLAGLLRKFEAQRAQADEEHLKTILANIERLPIFVSREEAAREAREYLAHPLAATLRLQEAYLADAK